jgi:DNA repair exonuclease SbcCD nuclease subunit
MNKILVIGDLHFKEFLSYGDYIKDKRVAEKESILKFIVSEAKDCDSIVLMGDNFDHRNNSAEVVRSFVEFIEKFGNKDVYILSGNHEKKGDGKTAIDFLKEVKKSNWHIFTKITSGYEMQGIRVDFVPFMLKSELEVETDDKAAKEI